MLTTTEALADVKERAQAMLKEKALLGDRGALDALLWAVEMTGKLKGARLALGIPIPVETV